jgi:aspartyl-tRNA(Asn)/glutamyl-tRNA(Gln) amidotransferase subunit A
VQDSLLRRLVLIGVIWGISRGLQLIAARLEHPDRATEWDAAFEARQEAASKTAMNAMLPGKPWPSSSCSDGLLQGVPVTFKASFCIKGTVSDACSDILDGYVAPYTGTAPQRLLDAGARMMGKCNQDEFAMGASSTFSRYGRVVNPHSPGLLAENQPGAAAGANLSAGGSSGGSAASVAAGTSLVSLGSDTGGSVRQPAAFCGVVGFKPTYGRLSRHGLIAFASSLDTPGIVTRTVADAALVFDVMAGHDPADDTSIRTKRRSLPSAEDVSKALHDSVADGGTPQARARSDSCFGADLIHGRLPTMATSSSAAPDGLLAHMRGKRVGIPAQCDVAELPGAIRSAWEQSAQWLADAGSEIVPVSIPLMQRALSAYYILAPAEAASNLARYDGVRYGLRVDPQECDESQTAEEAEVSGLERMYSATRSAGFGPEVQRRILTGNIVLSSSRRAEFYDAAARLRVELRHAMDRLFHAADSDKVSILPSARQGEIGRWVS